MNYIHASRDRGQWKDLRRDEDPVDGQDVDRILWTLTNGDGKLKISDLLRRCKGTRYADLDPILEELVKEGRIIRLPSKR